MGFAPRVKEAKRFNPTWALCALTGINLFNYLDRYVLSAILTPIKEELRLSDGALGHLQVAFMLGYFATAPFFGYLGDRFSRKALIIGGVAVWSMGTILSGWAPNLVLLLLFRILVGLGEASYGTVSPAWIADLYPSARRNLPLSIFYVAIPVGSALGFIVGGVVAAHFGWRMAFLAAGAPGLLIALSLLLLREPARGAQDESTRPAERSTAAGVVGTYAQLLRYPDYLITVAGYAAQTFVMGGFAFWAATYLHRAHGLGLEEADRFFGTALVLTGLAATLVGGYAATLWQRRSPAGYARVLALSAITTVFAAYAAFAAVGREPAEVAMVAAMFLIFLPTGPINTLILESVPASMRAAAMAASIFAIHALGDLWSPQIIGTLSDLTGSLRDATLWTLAPATVVSAFFWAWLAARQARAGAR